MISFGITNNYAWNSFQNVEKNVSNLWNLLNLSRDNYFYETIEWQTKRLSFSPIESIFLGANYISQCGCYIQTNPTKPNQTDSNFNPNRLWNY